MKKATASSDFNFLVVRKCLFLSFLLLFAFNSPVLASSLLLDAGNGVTWGDFKVEDVEVDEETEYFNPSLSIEYRMGENENFAIGVGYSGSENEFTGDYSGNDGKEYKGNVDVDRTTLDAYVRFIPSPNFNIRLGYRYFKYEFTDGYYEKTQYGSHHSSDPITGVPSLVFVSSRSRSQQNMTGSIIVRCIHQVLVM